MAYPARSNFNSSIPGSAWWTVLAPGGGTVLCSTTGYAFVRTLQRKLGVRVDGRWGPETAGALASRIDAFNGDAVLSNAVRADAAAHVLHIGSVAAAIWYLHLDTIGAAPSQVDSSAISLPAGVIPPPWITAAPGGSSLDTGIRCVAQGAASSSPAPPRSTASVPLNSNGLPVSNLPDLSMPGSSIPSTPISMNPPPGQSAPTPAPAPAAPGSVPWGKIAIVGAATVTAAVIIGAVWKSTPRQNPFRRRR